MATAAVEFGASDRADPVLMPIRSDHWHRAVAPILSILILAASLHQLASLDLGQSLALLPSAPSFWLVFALYYLIGPVADWAIFRRLWRLPARGFAALVRKTISNEIVLGYSGELYFYTWVRRNVSLVGTPFGAIRDVAILSAGIGNLATILLLAATYPFLSDLQLGLKSRVLLGSLAIVLASSVAILVFGRRVYCLRRNEIAYVAAAHGLRIVGATALTALLWRLLIPTAPLHWWLLLAALRLLVSRLPLVPNKDVVFAALAAFLIGQQADVANALALVAGLAVAAHLIVGAVLAIGEFVNFRLTPAA